MTELANISLDSLIKLAKNCKGKKAYIVERGKDSTDNEDISISAIIDTKDVLYNSEEKFWFYRYNKSDRIYFDNNSHPYWQAYFGKENFKLYDGIFIGHYGCGGHDRYIDIIIKAKSDLSLTKDYKTILQQFNESYKRYQNEKGGIIIDKIRAKFGTIKDKTNEIDQFAQYLNLDSSESTNKKEKDILIFWNWFENNFINEKEYEEKINKTTKVEHKKAFSNYIGSIVSNLEKLGFKEIKK